MVVEPESLCWLTGRMVKARDGATWAEEFARFPALRAVVRDDGSGLGRGVKLERDRRRAAGLADLDDSLDVFHTLREGGRALRKTWGAAARALEHADTVQKGLDRLSCQGQSCQGHGAARNRLWRQAEQLWDQAAAAETAWKQVRSAFEFFTPEGRLNDRAQAAAVVAAAVPHLSGAEWAKTRRLLLRRESFTFLDQVHERLAGLGLDGAVGPGRPASPAVAPVGRHTRLGLGPHGPVDEGVSGLARRGRACPCCPSWGLACEQPGGMRQ